MSGPWWDGSVIYQVYPRSFADTDGDGIGDLPGVAAHLDHLAGPDGLGVDAVWLSPFFPHGGVDGGYDITDFTGVAPEYGSHADVERRSDPRSRARPARVVGPRGRAYV